MQSTAAQGQIARREGNFDVPLAHFRLDCPNCHDSTGIKIAEDALQAESDADRTASSKKIMKQPTGPSRKTGTPQL